MALKENFVKQIQAGEQTYDIAVAHGIKFNQGSQSWTWDGTIADNAEPGYIFEVNIPTLSDLVTSPIVFAGTVGSDGTISWASGYSAPAQKGYLVYITADCTFDGVACEAGDMAICTYVEDNYPAWEVISGENQVEINAVAATVSGNDNVFSISGTAKTLLTVEGKTLSVNIDYADVQRHLGYEKNAAELSIALDEGATVTVPSTYVGLTKASDSQVTIGVEKSISLPTSLASGAVTFTNNSILVPSDFTWDAGTLPSSSSSAVSVAISHNLSIGKSNANDGATGDYVTSVDAIGSAVIAEGTQGDGIKYVSGISAAAGTSFLTGVHAHTDADTDAAAFTVYGAVTAASTDNTFATGFESATSADADVVSAITVGTVTGTFVTGLSSASSVITSVTFGDASVSNDRQWFVSDLSTNGSDVVSDVTFDTYSFVSDPTGGSSAVVSATVSDHVLSFNTSKFMTPVTLSKTDGSVTKKGFVKSGIALTGFSSASDTLATAAVSQADSTITYKKLTKASVSLTQDSIAYHYDKAASNVYSAEFGYVKVSTAAATVSKNTPTLENTTITGSIAAGSVITSVSVGTLPSLTIAEPSTTITGAVDTSLSVSTETWYAVDSTKVSLDIPGAYSLTSDSSVTGALEVGAAGTYNLANGGVTIPSDTFVTDVTVDGTSVNSGIE